MHHQAYFFDCLTKTTKSKKKEAKTVYAANGSAFVAENSAAFACG
jgi:hypothetical protein